MAVVEATATAISALPPIRAEPTRIRFRPGSALFLEDMRRTHIKNIDETQSGPRKQPIHEGYHIYIYVSVYVFMCICVYVYMCICVYVYMCICVYVYVYVYVYSHVRIFEGIESTVEHVHQRISGKVMGMTRI